MNYCHMQLHPGEFAAWSNSDIRGLPSSGLFGCAGAPVAEFNKMKIGDIILVRHGGDGLALVQAMENPRKIAQLEKVDDVWFTDCLKVKILAQYDKERVVDKGIFLRD
jgi:5-methylcytosine-specific restriction protein B